MIIIHKITISDSKDEKSYEFHNKDERDIFFQEVLEIIDDYYEQYLEAIKEGEVVQQGMPASGKTR